jgi:PAS domain S-box-containing protein
LSLSSAHPASPLGPGSQEDAPSDNLVLPAEDAEAALRYLADAVPDLVWMARPDGTVDYFNQNAERYEGIARQDDGVWVWGAVLHPEDAERTAAAWQHAVETGEPYEIEHRVRMADGGYRWHLSRALPVRDASGTIMRWYGTATDIHRVKEAEAALAESEERYRVLFDSMDQGFCVLEMILDESGQPVDYRFVEANEAFESQTGLVNAVGRTARELVPNLEDHWVETYGRVASTGEPLRFEQQSAAIGRWFDVYASPIGPPENRRVALLFTDITRRREIQEAVRESEQRYHALFSQAPAFIAVLRGPEHRFEFVNPAYLRLVGNRDLLGKTVREALPEVEGQGFFEILDQVFGNGETFVATDLLIRLQRHEGGRPERRFVDFVYEPLRDADGAVEGVIVVGVDTTERVNAKEQLQHANRKLERTNQELEQINRDLEERVDVRTWQVRKLSRELTLAEQRERQRIAYVIHEDLQQLIVAAKVVGSLEDAERLQSVLDQALMVSKTLSHELSPPLLEDQDLRGLFRWLVRQKRDKYGLEVEIDMREDVRVPDSALRVLLYQILRELLLNVVKHSGTKEAVVHASRQGDHVLIVVEDEGRGFDVAILKELEEVGFGLRSVRERLELVGGRVTVDSRPGRGTLIAIDVPAEGQMPDTL